MFNSDSNVTRATGAIGPDGVAGCSATSTSNGGMTARNTTVPNDSNTHTVAVLVPKSSVSAPVGITGLLVGGTAVIPSPFNIDRLTGTITAGSGFVVDCGAYWLIGQSVTNNSTGNTTLVTRFYPGASATGQCDAYDLQVLINQTYATSVIPAASTTRNADAISTDLSSIGYGSAPPFTYLVQWGRVQKPASGRHYLLSIDDGSANNRIAMFLDTNGYVNGEVVAGGVQQALLTGAVDLSAGSKAAFAVATNDVELIANGASIGTSSSATMPTGLTTWRHGSDQAGANQLDGPIKREAAWRSRQARPFLLASSAFGSPFARILTHWFSGNVSGKTVCFVGDSTTQNATSLFSWLTSYAQVAGGGLNGVTVLNYGENGASLEAFLSDSVTHGITATIAAKADLYVFCYGINSVRLGTDDLPTLEAAMDNAVNQIRAGVPNADIVLWGPNCFLTTDVNSNGYVVPNSSAQAYSDILYNAYASKIGKWPNVAVLQKQDGVFGRVCPATSIYMTDQLHPNTLGQQEETHQLVNYIGQFC